MGAGKIIYGINNIIPKGKTILFNSFPDLNGNALALYEYIIKNRPDLLEKYRLVWSVAFMTVGDAVKMLQERTGIKKHNVVAKKSIKGILTFLTAKYLVSTHYYFPSVKTGAKQVNINLWHGMPFKRIGRLLEEEEVTEVQDYADITIATSPVFQELMAKAFNIDKSSVLVTGQPCNDYFGDSKVEMEKIVPNLESFKKAVVWLPTYRTSVVGEIRQDGKADSFGVAEVLLEHFEELDDCLKSNGYLLVVKPHPMDSISAIDLPESDNIKIVTNSDLTGKNIQLYEFLSGSDVLLTDYSSVFIDLLVSGKPMAFVCDDIDEYGSSRGFCFDPPRDYMPGELIRNSEQFIDYLNHMDEINGKWSVKYTALREILNPFCDSNASERVCNAVWGNK